MAEKTKAVAVRNQGAMQLSAADQSLYAQCVQLSKSSAVPMAYIDKPDQIFSTVVYGREFGLGAMSSLCNIFNVNGKPAMNVHLILGLCMKHKEYAGYEIKEHTEKKCTIIMYRFNALSNKAFAYDGSWSIEEATNAGLMGSGMYKKYPKNMLFARAVTFAARKAFPDILGGLYSVEEMNPDAYEIEDMESVQAIVDDAEEYKPDKIQPIGGAKAPSAIKATSKAKPTSAAKPAAKNANVIAPNRK